MKLQLLRNATQILCINGKTLLIDPMLAPKGSYPPFQNTPNTRSNPIANLPVSKTELDEIIAAVDAVLLTHLHLDHWDDAAREMLAKNIPIFCQPANVDAINATGFTNLIPVTGEVTWNGITINRTGGRHGTGEIGERMGQVSGFVIACDDEKLYIAGDTIWCTEVQQAIDTYKPTHIVLNGGGARFTAGDAIVMTIDDIITVCNYTTAAKVYVVHLEAVNHSAESRDTIKTALATHKLLNRCFVPDDGEHFIITD